jgi:hypothetical protein
MGQAEIAKHGSQKNSVHCVHGQKIFEKKPLFFPYKV